MGRKHRKPSSPPSANGIERLSEDGRGADGKFQNGNRHGRGGAPLAARALKLRAALLAAVSSRDVAEIVSKLVERAKKGDVRAAREILNRAIGKPTATDQREALQIAVFADSILADRVDAIRSLRLAQARGEALDLRPDDNPRERATEIVVLDPINERRRLRRELGEDDR